MLQYNVIISIFSLIKWRNIQIKYVEYSRTRQFKTGREHTKRYMEYRGIGNCTSHTLLWSQHDHGVFITIIWIFFILCVYLLNTQTWSRGLLFDLLFPDSHGSYSLRIDLTSPGFQITDLLRSTTSFWSALLALPLLSHDYILLVTLEGFNY